MMTQNLAQLELLAIQAAKNQNWQAAVDHNQEIVNQNPNDIGALNRLGVAHVQLSDTTAAKKCFNQVLEIDKTNQLAKKHLQKIKNHQPINLSVFQNNEEFIEEPGKTKTVDLFRLAGKDQLAKISVGQQCELKPKNRFISIEAEGVYAGSLPEDLSARLAKLMKGGNKYTCYIRSLSTTAVSVFIKEVSRSAQQKDINSFPISKNQMSVNEMFLMDEDISLLEDIPPEIVETDADERIPVIAITDGDMEEHHDDANQSNEPEPEPDEE